MILVNLKRREFFKFSSLLSKREGREKEGDGRGGIFNHLSSLPGEPDFVPLPSNVKKSQLKAGPAQIFSFKGRRMEGRRGLGCRGEGERERERRRKKNDLMKFHYQLQTNMQNIWLEIK